MRVLIVTAGSRGDVAPYTGLGRRLQQAGHDVAIAAHGLFADLVRDCGAEYRSLPGDPVELTRARTAAPSSRAGRAVFAEFLEELAEGLVGVAAAGTDLVLTAFGPAPLSRTVAEGLGVPSVGTYLVPAVPTTAFPPPGWPGPGDLGPAGNRAAGDQLLSRAANLYADIVPKLRARLGLAPAPAAEAGAGKPDGWPICHGFSPAVVPRPADWPAEVRVSGYWWPSTPPGWQPPSELVDFLGAGPPPVFVGFGSMTVDGARLSEIVTAAIRRARVRAVVQAGWAGLSSAGDDILQVGDVPHEWLFPRTALVVHHAGAGTTGVGVRAGVPAVTVPVMLDQPFWAERLHWLGVAPAPLPQRELTADTLTTAIRRCLDEPSYRNRAGELARRVRAEDGAADVLNLIGTLCN